MQRSYLSIILVVQAVVSISHIMILIASNYVSLRIPREKHHHCNFDSNQLQDAKDRPVIPDVFIYAFTLLTFVIFLLPAFNEDVSNTFRPFICSFLAILSQVTAGKPFPANQR